MRLLPLLLTLAAPLAQAGDGVAPFVGVRIAGAVHLDQLPAVVSPSLDLGLELPALDRRIRLFATGSHSRPKVERSGTEPHTADGTFSYTLRESVWTMGFGGVVRITNDAPLEFEVLAVPGVAFLRSRIDGVAGGAAIPESQEFIVRPTFMLAPGVRQRLGPGELTGHVGFAWAPMNGIVTGPAHTGALSLHVGYRLIASK